MKINKDKYYTDPELALKLINKTYEIIGKENITEIIEPSAGNGSFSLQIPNCIAYDIEPENNSVIKQDYLKLDINYKKERLIIGNPPFGKARIGFLNFYKKCIKECDFIAFILPISQYNNTNILYEFDLIYSENLGKLYYSNKKIHCCFNIYKRPIKGLNKSKHIKIEGIKLRDNRRNFTKNLKEGWDFGICSWGASIGKQTKYKGEYASEIYFYIDREDKKEIKEFILNTKWEDIYPMISTPKIQHWKILKHLKGNYFKNREY